MRSATATNPRLIAMNDNQPAWEWNPPAATAGDSHVPTATSAAIRTPLASHMKAAPRGSRSSAWGNSRRRRGAPEVDGQEGPDQADALVTGTLRRDLDDERRGPHEEAVGADMDLWADQPEEAGGEPEGRPTERPPERLQERAKADDGGADDRPGDRGDYRAAREEAPGAGR